MGRAFAAVVCSFAGSLVLVLGAPITPAATGGGGLRSSVAPPPRVLPAGNTPFNSGQCQAVMPASQAAGVHGFSHAVHDARAQASFVTRFGPDGRAQLTARAGDLEVEKNVGPDGSFEAALKAGEDEVRLGVRFAGVDVTRGGRTVHVELGRASDDELLQVKQLLAGSRAVRRHRVLAANLEPRTLRTPAGVATVVLDAFLAVLDGDPSAIERLTQKISKRGPATMRQVRREDSDSCYLEWEREVMEAWWSYAACMSRFSIWNPLKEICTARYMLWVESAWWRFISCSAFPIRLE